MLRRLLVLFALLLGWAAPAHADDISASGRGVVRVVTIAVVGDEVVGFGHGSGFAIAPDRIVTNAHVVELATRYPANVIIGVVPSEGDRSYQGRLVAVDADRDLALIEFKGVRLPPLSLHSGAVDEGSPVVALGYPGNVDLATARSAADFITPLSPVRSQGVLSGARTLSGTGVLLHTANIARGNSGGPLLDRCGRVLGVNSALTRSDEGDASFGFAIANRELAAFLGAARQRFTSVALPCVSIEERMAQDRTATEQAEAAARLQREAEAARNAANRESAIAEARARNETLRENFMAGAAVLLVLGALAIGGGGLLLTRDLGREALIAAIAGVALMIAAVVLFVMRPSFDPARLVPVPQPPPTPVAIADPAGRMLCKLVPERSRVTVSSTADVTLDWGEDGCVNGRTQYAEAGGRWQRILVPGEEAAVSVLDYDPATRLYTATRYLLDGEGMKRARQLRAAVTLKACSTDQAARGNLATQQAAIRAALPQLPNEKIVYACSAAPVEQAGPGARN